MAVVAGKLAEWNPSDPGRFISLAYATRRSESIGAAHAILKRAEGLHPDEATVQFNLACYEAQMSNPGQAKLNLEPATRIDPRFRLLALEDADLEPLWDSLAAD